MKLVIAEKPSVGKDIAKILGASYNGNGYCEGNGYICTWAYGHLVTLYDCSDYDEEWKSWKKVPVIPDEFKIKLNPAKGVKEQIKVIDKLMKRNDVTEIVCATDAGREGELIFRHIYNYLKCSKPVKRLWINSLTEEDIKKGFNSLDNGDTVKYRNLYESAFAREKADWLVGMNLTRCFSNMYCHYGDKPLSIGRVQTPTLKMIVDREKEIISHVKKYSYRPEIKYSNITAEYIEKFENKEDAELIARRAGDQDFIVSKVKIETKRKKAPLLFDITSLQKECNKKYGLSAQQTLDTAQNLYEKKLITYPRTDSKFLNSTMKSETEALIGKLYGAKGISFKIDTDAVIDDSKVTDHHAIIPTNRILSKYSLTDQEQKVLDLIIIRLMSSVAPPMIYEHIKAAVNKDDLEFNAAAKRTVDPGWTVIDGTSSMIEDEGKNTELFDCKENDVWKSVKSKVNCTLSKPKPRFTEETILTAMENAGSKEFKNIEGIERTGLGTGATRAAIIEVLLSRGYIERKKRNLIPTKRGIDLIEAVPEKVTDVAMTIEWEEQIAEIKNGKRTSDRFIRDIENYVKQVISENYDSDKTNDSSKETGNFCPECGSRMIIKHSKYGEFEACSNYPECKYINKSKKKAEYTKLKCPKCGGYLVKRNGKFGEFLGCSNYPKCTFVKK